jgi:hypothetical protein
MDFRGKSGAQVTARATALAERLSVPQITADLRITPIRQPWALELAPSAAPCEDHRSGRAAR